MTKRNWSEEREAIEALLFQKRVSLAEIARRYGVTRQYISILLKRWGILVPNNLLKRQIPNIDTKEFWEEQAARLERPTSFTLGDAVGVAHHTVKRYLKSLGLEHLIKHSPRPLEEIVAERTYEDGECLIWNGGVAFTGKKNYPTLKHAHYPEERYANRIIYRHYNGPIPEGHAIIKDCGNDLCVKPEHLKAVDWKYLAKNRKPRS